MSRSTVAGKVEALLSTLSEIGQSAFRVYAGLPEPVPDTELPIAVYYLRQPEYRPLTMSTAGLVSVRYNVDIWFLLGPPLMLQQDAEAAQRIYAERMRSLFAGGNTTLDGTVFDSDVTEGSDNIQTYREAGEYPQATFRVQVTELVARSSP